MGSQQSSFISLVIKRSSTTQGGSQVGYIIKRIDSFASGWVLGDSHVKISKNWPLYIISGYCQK